MPNRRYPIALLSPLRLITVITAGLLWLTPTTPCLSETAHGGSPAGSPNDAPPPGAAVSAARVTEPFTEKGQTLNPIAIDFDPQGGLYVVEAWRAGVSAIDNRHGGLKKTGGAIHDLSKTSVKDRLTQIDWLLAEGHYPEGTFTQNADKIRFLQDTDGDGRADKAAVFADGFDDKLDGIAAGVLYHEGRVYLTCIPHLWLLEDKDGDGDADETTEGERISLSYGYGVRWAFFGHDMHGLIKGPDGRIYFSIGDRGYNVTNQEGEHLYGPHQGAVFRMWPDGSGLEVFHEGLRNPQELAFDNYGNLFTGDNNCDAGDLARFVFVAEGGHSGWNQDVQSLRHRGPWMREEMWRPRLGKDDPTQPAWITHPIKNVGRGPSGLAHYPGTGDVFADNGSFLMCDYPTGVRHVQVKPDGAFFKITEDSLFTDDDAITDVAWGYDGKLYLADWGGGWRPNPNGSIKTMTNAAAHEEQAAALKEVQALFANGFDTLSDEALIDLLGHRDQRVRLHAQWQIATRKGIETKLFKLLSDETAPELAQIHAVWAIGMCARRGGEGLKHEVIALIAMSLDHANPNIRAQVAKTLGDAGWPMVTGKLSAMLDDESLAVQYHAAIALGKAGGANHIPALLNLLERNHNKDAMIRHAASYGLSLIGEADAIHEQAQPMGPAARLGAVLALRRLKSPLLAEYLDDENLLVAAEAARAIYDMRIMDVMPRLASSVPTTDQMIEPIMRRIIEANVRLADADSAVRLARIAENQRYPDEWRLLALKELENWSAKRNREGVWGSWWPRLDQSMDNAVEAMAASIPSILEGADGELKTLARTLLQQHVAKTSPTQLEATALSPEEPDALRLGSLNLLAEADPDRCIKVAKQLAASENCSAELRKASRLTLIGLDKQAGQKAYADAIGSGTLLEQQDAIKRLGRSGAGAKGAIPGGTFVMLADQLNKGQLDPSLRLDVVEAVLGNQAMPAPARLKVQRYIDQNRAPGEEPFIRDAVLAGGSVERGREVFLHNEAASCTQCHRLDDEPAQGPNLAAIGAVHDIGYLYTAIVHPSADIADGYATVSINLNDGGSLSGRALHSQSDAKTLVIIDAENKTHKIARGDIAGEPVISTRSNMKAMNEALTPRELRDLLAYLASLQDVSAVAAVASAEDSAAFAPKIVNPMKGVDTQLGLLVFLAAVAAGLGGLLVLTLVANRMPTSG